jgi:hypothetical protein
MLKVVTAPHGVLEKRYAWHVLLTELLQVPHTVETDPSATETRIVLPNGNVIVMEEHFNWDLSLAKLPIKTTPLNTPFGDVLGIYGRENFSQTPQRVHCGIDLAASAFFMLTRWEEAISTERDQHGRFPAQAAFAVRHGFLRRPVVNEYADFLRQALAHLGYAVPAGKRRFQVVLTHDVDHPRLWWSATGRLRSVLGAAFRRRDMEEARFWAGFPRGKDPYDVFDTWMDETEALGLTAQYNFMGARQRNSDCYYPLQHPFVKNLIQKIARRGHRIGFHASYEAHDSQSAFRAELASVREASPVEVNSGRQHYLRFSLPDTWRSWNDAGMQEDSTLGHSEMNGFRCGICHDFPVFDIRSREMLPLRERPLIAMDVTTALYQGMTPAEAAEDMLDLKRKTTRHHGDFVLLWHNSSWSSPFWQPWQAAFRETLTKL